MTRFLVIDRTGLGRAALNAAQERGDSLGPEAVVTPYDAVVADICLTDDGRDGEAEPHTGNRLAEVQAPDFRKLAWRLSN